MCLCKGKIKLYFIDKNTAGIHRGSRRLTKNRIEGGKENMQDKSIVGQYC